jgi:hypothetical protein
MRSHFEDALTLNKPVVLGEFGRQHSAGMPTRLSFFQMVYTEVRAP